jgi:hypothetical protein
LFLDKKAYIPSITLAGAAEDILGSIVVNNGAQSAHAELSDILSNKFGISIKELNDKYLNLARNSLKHANLIEGETIELEPENESIQMILRCITNLIKFDKSLSSESPRFLDWLSENRLDLFNDL